MRDDVTFSGHPTRGTPEFQPGRRLGVYELQELLGQGGMGQVWKAWDTQGNRPVALKLLPAEFRGNEEAIAQVRAAFAAVHDLTHQGLCKMLALVEDQQHGPYIVMDYFPGITLSKYRRSLPEGRLTVEQVVSVLRPVAEALDFAHRKVIGSGDRSKLGVLHRDVKPQNIMLTLRGNKIGDVCLIDLGLAAEIRSTTTRFTQARVDTRGTRPYMSPEQLAGKRGQWDGRTDQYSLAAVAYELLAGHPPFEGDDDSVLIHAITTIEPDAIPGISESVNAALLKALAKRKEQRFDSCREFVDALIMPVRQVPQGVMDAKTQGTIDANWRTYEELLNDGQDKEDDFLRSHAPSLLRVWRIGAEHGKPQAQVLLGECYLQGIETEKAPAEALKWFRKAAEQGFAVGQGALGAMYMDGEGVAKDSAEALKWLRKAAEKGFAPSQGALGAMYIEGTAVSKDTDEGLKWLRKAAEKGYAPVQLILANAYETGEGVPMDEEEAAKWFRKALKWLRETAEQGRHTSQLALGTIYKVGRGVPKNDAEAFKWLSKAAEQGSVAAQSLLGLMYFEGQGVSQDDREAVNWFRKSAEEGNATSQSFLGIMYLQGRGGLPEDRTEGFKWLHKAAEQGSRAGQFLLGVFYEKAKNTAEAREWYGKAAAQGHEKSKEALERLGRSFWRRALGI